MSNTQTQDVQMPSYDDAYNFLFRNLHAQVFTEKLASYGINPQSEEELGEYLTLAGNLRKIEDQLHVKQASDQMSLVKMANQQLSSHLGLSQQNFHAEEEASIKNAVASVCSSPDIYNSILSLKWYEAKELLDNKA